MTDAGINDNRLTSLKPVAELIEKEAHLLARLAGIELDINIMRREIVRLRTLMAMQENRNTNTLTPARKQDRRRARFDGLSLLKPDSD